MENLKITKETPREDKNKRNIKYQRVYNSIEETPNEWVKIEPLTKREVASIRQYYIKRHIYVVTRTEKVEDHFVLYIKREVLE